MTPKPLPLVSVVCLCYNHEKTVADAVESVLGQKTDFPFELIVHDDASTDATPEIVRAYAEKYPDTVIPVLQSENQIRRCNIAETHIAPLLRGRYVAICEGDDYWMDPEKLARQVSVMEAHPEVTLCFHAVDEVSADGTVRPYRPLKAEGPAPAETVVKRGGMFCPSVSLLVRREVADLWPAFRRQADVYDYPLQVLAAAEGTVWYLDRRMAAYRFQHENSWTAQRARETDWAHLENETAWLKSFSEYTQGRFDYEINYHLAHLWFTEYRKHPDKDLLRQLKPRIKALRGRDKCVFSLLTLLYTLFGAGADRIYLFIKRRMLK